MQIVQNALAKITKTLSPNGFASVFYLSCAKRSQSPPLQLSLHNSLQRIAHRPK